MQPTRDLSPTHACRANARRLGGTAYVRCETCGSLTADYTAEQITTVTGVRYDVRLWRERPMAYDYWREFMRPADGLGADFHNPWSDAATIVAIRPRGWQKPYTRRWWRGPNGGVHLVPLAFDRCTQGVIRPMSSYPLSRVATDYRPWRDVVLTPSDWPARTVRMRYPRRRPTLRAERLSTGAVRISKSDLAAMLRHDLLRIAGSGLSAYADK